MRRLGNLRIVLVKPEEGSLCVFSGASLTNALDQLPHGSEGHSV